ncbi:MAG: Hsp20 family protein [Alphaproteobacteria bacterium]|nr:Hsp20 family protein [Alphaproteobacteria bacterium]MCB9931508.1 Hsp20 family protein [Alphaproteobacteria bacterium]
MTTFDFSPLFRSTVGFDRMQRMLEAATRGDEANGYPPYNIERLEENAYRITMAVAGFAESDIEIEVKDGVLVVTGRQAEDQAERTFLHRGIAGRAFRRSFQLADHVKVQGAALENGLLHVDLAREIPEAMKPRKIAINGRAPVEIEAQAA